MEPLFTVRTAYSDQMYYHIAAAGKQRETVNQNKTGPFWGIGAAEAALAPILFFVFFMTFRSLELSLRVMQSLLSALIATAFWMYMNRQKSAGGGAALRQAEYDKNQAKTACESSGLKGVVCRISFFEDFFRVESPTVITEYRYEGTAQVKETSKYYLIYRDRARAVAVDKERFDQGKPELFAPFIQSKCGKTIETVRVPD